VLPLLQSTQERFETDPFENNRWVLSEFKPASDMGKWAWTAGQWYTDAEKDRGIQTQTDMKNHATSSKIDKSFSNRDKPLIVQFSVKHENKDFSYCAGGYIKLLPSNTDQKKFGGDTPYSIMFGPDLCGYDVSRIHVIFTEKSGKNLLNKDDIKLEYADKDEYTHLYTLIVNPDKTYKVLFDNKDRANGSILEQWDFQPKMIPDPDEKKPEDWDEREQIVDPAAKKPDDWDQPEYIPDPEATKPDEWDQDLDGEWEAPLVKNPKFKGEWKAPLIANPAYKGKWKAKDIPNPKYDPEVVIYDDLGVVGFELWTVNNGTIFDNILVTDDIEYAEKVAKELWQVTADGEKAAKEKWGLARQKEKDAKAKQEKEAKASESTETKASEDADDYDDDVEDDSGKKDEL